MKGSFSIVLIAAISMALWSSACSDAADAADALVSGDSSQVCDASADGCAGHERDVAADGFRDAFVDERHDQMDSKAGCDGRFVDGAEVPCDVDSDGGIADNAGPADCSADPAGPYDGHVDGGTDPFSDATDTSDSNGIDSRADDAWEPGLIPVAAPSDWNPDPRFTPVGIHMTWNHDPAVSVSFQWETAETDASVYVPKVWLVKAADAPWLDAGAFDVEGPMPFDTALAAEGRARLFCPVYRCEESTPKASLWQVDVDGLEPDTQYFYRVGTWDSFDLSEGRFSGVQVSPMRHFRTGIPSRSGMPRIPDGPDIPDGPGLPVAADLTAQPWMFGFGSDSQTWYENAARSISTIRDTTGRSARFWLFGGDLTEYGELPELRAWFEMMAPITAYYPVMPVAGNHDFPKSVVYGMFAMPEMAGLEADLIGGAWSFDFGHVHFAGFESNSSAQVERQIAWLEQDLAAAAANPEIWFKVVVFHHPAYSSCDFHGSTSYIQKLAVPLFDRYGVDLALSGHDHDYERTFPLTAGEIDTQGKGTVYITAGGFYSNKWYNNGTSDFTAVSFNGIIHNYLVFVVDAGNMTGITFSGSHEIIDTFTIHRRAVNPE